MPLLETPGHSWESLRQSLLGLLLLSLGSWCTQGFVCVLQGSVSPVLFEYCNQIPLASKVKFPGDSQSLCQIPRLGSLTQGSEPSQQWENSLVLLFSSLWVTHLEGMGFDLIVVAPLLPSHCGYFVFGLGVSFLSVPASFC